MLACDSCVPSYLLGLLAKIKCSICSVIVKNYHLGQSIQCKVLLDFLGLDDLAVRLRRLGRPHVISGLHLSHQSVARLFSLLSTPLHSTPLHSTPCI